MQAFVSTAATLSAPGSPSRKASSAEASSTASVTVLPGHFVAAVAQELVGEPNALRCRAGKVRLHVTRDVAERAHDDALFGRLQHDGSSWREPIVVAQARRDDDPAAWAYLGVNGVLHGGGTSASRGRQAHSATIPASCQ